MEILITGHRNPDMDSVCSAWAYARLKNQLGTGDYAPVMLGQANRNTKKLFDSLSLELPAFIHDVKPRVRQIAKHPTYSMKSSDPVYLLMDLFARMKPTVVPVIDDGEYRGLLSSDDMNAFFLKESVNGERQSYLLSEDNIGRVIKGAFLKRSSENVLQAPYMVGAMEYQVFLSRLEKCKEKPVLITGDRRKHIQSAIDAGLPGIVLTGIEDLDAFDIDFSGYAGFVYLSAYDTAETLRLLRLSTPISAIIPKEGMSVDASDFFDDAKKKLQNSDIRGMSVFEDGKWIGFVTRRCFLDKPRQKVILVDHNETEQSVLGIEDAEIVEIIDHHRLAAPRMKSPIYISSEPLGSTCTIVYEHFRKWDVEIDVTSAKVLLAGLLSDTVILKSPTTTDFDRHVASKLASIAGVDVQSFGSQLFSDSPSLASLDPDDVLRSDMKRYNERGVSFAISQAEVTNLAELDDVKPKYIAALEKERDALQIDWAMLMITDVIAESSILLSTDFGKASYLPYEKIDEGAFSLPGVLSRKKQLLPEVLSILED